MQAQNETTTESNTTSWADNTVAEEWTTQSSNNTSATTDTTTTSNVELSVGTEYVARVKWFNNTKGYGFVTVLDNEADLFVHHSEIKPHSQCWRTLMTGEYIQVTVGQDNQGKLCGLNVTGIQGGQLLCEHMTPYMANRFQSNTQKVNNTNVAENTSVTTNVTTTENTQ